MVLREDYPASPLGYAGPADLLLDRAAEVRSRGLRPFQARAWERQALSLYEVARSLSSDPQVLAGHTRALNVLGRHDEAATVLDQMPAALTHSPGGTVGALHHAQSTGDFDAAVAQIVAAEPADPMRIFPVEPNRVRGFERLDGVHVRMLDASSAAVGGADVADVAFIPTARRSYLSGAAWTTTSTTPSSCSAQTSAPIGKP